MPASSPLAQTALRRQLSEGCAVLRLALPDAAIDALMRYLAELQKWNRAYNLTAIRAPEEMVTRHLLDALSVLPAMQALALPKGLRLLDVGAGAGIPGLMLAVARPDWAITVLDSNGKKTRFMRHAVRTLGLTNVTVVQARAEAFEAEARFDVVMSRAYTALGGFFASTAQLLAANGCWLAMKGKLDADELAHGIQGVAIMQVLALYVPGLDETRQLVVARHGAAA